MNFKVLILRMFSVVTWGQALFSFHFENNIPVGKVKDSY